MGVRASRVCVSVCVCECVCDCVSSVLLCVFIARVSTLRSGRSVLVTPPPRRALFTYGARPMVSPWLVALPAVHSSCASSACG